MLLVLSVAVTQQQTVLAQSNQEWRDSLNVLNQ